MYFELEDNEIEDGEYKSRVVKMLLVEWSLILVAGLTPVFLR